MYEDSDKMRFLPTNNNQPVVFVRCTRLAFHEEIGTLFMGAALDLTNFPIVACFQLDIEPEMSSESGFGKKLLIEMLNCKNGR
jgi:hypothetical protein